MNRKHFLLATSLLLTTGSASAELKHTSSTGWMLGMDIGRYEQDNWFGEDYPERNDALISAGYRF